MSSLRDRSNRLKPKSRGKYLSFYGALALLVLPSAVTQANATGGEPTAGMYLDQPFVQGSYVAEDFPSETSVTTFNDQSYSNTCSINGGVVQPLYAGSPDCHVQTEINYGGASNTSSTPVVGQYPIPVNYGQVGGGGASVIFETPQTYFGLWWSAGSAGNEIQLWSGSNLVASTSANDVASTLYSSGLLTAQSGAQYATRFYTGNPVDWYSVGTPTDFSDQDEINTYQSNRTLAQEPFVFIHFIAAAGITFDRVNLIAPGNGFEFDNFTTSSATGIRAAGIPSRLVLQRELYEPTYVDFDANGGSGALPRQYSVDSGTGYLQANCLDYEDSTRCISALNNSYSAQFLGWNTASDGSGSGYEYMGSYPFSVSQTLYAQWKNEFTFYNLTNSAADATNVWDYVDFGSQTSSSVLNFGDLTLPSPETSGQYLEGWYTFDPTWSYLMRVGGPGDTISGSSYTTWDSNIFGRWLENPPPPTSVDALTPQVLPVYPRAKSVALPSMPLTGDVSASICLVESDSLGNQISSNLSYTDLATSTSGFSSSYLITSSIPLVSNSSRYVRVTVSPSSDSSCTTGFTHIIEIRPLAANLTKIFPLNLTAR